MNKMRTIEDIKGRVSQIINKEIEKTEREIADFAEKIRGNEYCYGGGGWNTQFTKAKERRERYLEELKTFGRNTDGERVILDTIYVYSYYCPSCATKVTLNAGYGEKVTCPICERTIYRSSEREEMQIKRGSRRAKLNRGNYIQLTAEGRIQESED